MLPAFSGVGSFSLRLTWQLPMYSVRVRKIILCCCNILCLCHNKCIDYLNESTAPNPETFDDYRMYLRTLVSYRKRTMPQFSYRFFARQAGFSSPSFLKLVIEGKRNLSRDSIAKFARGLKLNKQEREAFETLVCFCQAGTDSEKHYYYGKLRQFKQSAGVLAEMTKAQYDVYSLWYAMPIREMLALPDFQEDPEWIGKRLRPNVKPAKVAVALELLLRCGLVIRDGSGRLQQADRKLAAVKYVQTLAVRNYHRAQLKSAVNALETVPVDKRNITSVTVAITDAQYQVVCERIAAFQRELLDAIEDTSTDDSEKKEIHVLGFQVVPSYPKEKSRGKSRERSPAP